MRYFCYKKSFLSGLIGLILASQFLFVSSAYAVTVNVNSDTSSTNIKTSIESTISAAAETVQTGLMTALHIKELTLDGIAFGLMKTVLKGATRSILNWINSGFQGSPAFVTDLDGFLLDVADQTAGDFIYGTELGFLCSPFELDVRFALNVQYQQSRDYRPQCTVSEIVDNIDGFLSGNFSDGGWAGWFEITQDPYNNPTGAYLAANAEMSARLINAEGREIKLLEANDFFLNIEICDSSHSSAGSKPKCETTTPGKIISEQLTFELQSGPLALIEADEINEIVGALFAQLAQQAITGAYGLLGMGGNDRYTDRSFGSSGNLDYLSAIEEENAEIVSQLSDPTDFQLAIDSEREYIAFQNQIKNIVTTQKTNFDTIVDGFTVTNEAGTAEVICFDVEFPENLLDLIPRAEEEIAGAQAMITTIQGIRQRFNAATTSEAQSTVIDEFVSLRQSGQIKNEIDLVDVELFIRYDLLPRFVDPDDEFDTEGDRNSRQPEGRIEEESLEEALREEIARCEVDIGT